MERRNYIKKNLVMYTINLVFLDFKETENDTNKRK
jgi:hypothetical protein